MKKIIFLLLTSIIWLSCELPDSGRMAVIDFNFTQPDILREAETSAVPDRIIPLESKTVVVVMYPSFTDSVTEDDFWTLADGQLGTILDKVDTRVLYMNFGTSFTGGSLENIVPGDYSFAVYTFNTIISNTEDLLSNVFDAMTWRIKKDVTIVPGMNLVDLPLKLNLDYYVTDISSVSTPADVTISPNIYANPSLPTDTMFFSFTKFTAGECTVNFVTNLGPNVASLALYNEEGYLINQTTTLEGNSLIFNAAGPSYVLIVSIKNISPLGDFLNISVNSYVPGPPQILRLNVQGVF